MDLSKYNSGDFGFFVRPCISTLWGGDKMEVRGSEKLNGEYILFEIRQWTWYPPAQFKPHFPSSICLHSPYWNENVWRRWGLEILFDPLSWKYMQSSVGGAAGRRWIWNYCIWHHINVGFDIVSIFKKLYLTWDNVGFHILLKKFAKCKAGWALGRKSFGPKYF